MKTAGLRSSPDSPGWLWLAMLLGAVVLAGSLARGQVPPAAPAEAAENVVEIRVVGNRRVDTKKILSQIRTRTARPYDPELIEDDVRRLYKTGWFVTVRPKSQRVATGRMVIFEVLERPILEYVKYVGNEKIVKATLEKESELKQGDALNLFAVEEARRRVEEYYRNHGFSSARVTIVEGNRASDKGVIFLINEGQKQRIWETRFIGNTIASDARLRTQVRSKPGIFWLIKGEVNRDEIEEDKNRLTAYYRSLGFFRARVDRYFEFNDQHNWLTLTFVIDEGPRYTIRNVSFLGNSKFSSNDLAREMNLSSGAYFNQSEMQHDVATIRDKYGSVGYIFADVKADPRFLETPGKLDLVYDIREGFRCRVGKITPHIAGEIPHTRITTVLNRMSLKPGDIVDIRELRASERRLQASQLFEVDPTKGVSPKIVFSPPNLEDMEVQQARRDAGFRGQSPAPESHAAYRPPLPPDWSPDDRYVDVTIEGKWVTDPAEMSEPACSDRIPASSVRIHAVSAENERSGPVESGHYERRDEAGFYQQPDKSGYYKRPEAPVFRGQYSPDAGFSVPTNPYGSADPYSSTSQWQWSAGSSPRSTSSTPPYSQRDSSAPSYSQQNSSASPYLPPSTQGQARPAYSVAAQPNWPAPSSAGPTTFGGSQPPPEQLPPPGSGLPPAGPYGSPNVSPRPPGLAGGEPSLLGPRVGDEPPIYVPLVPELRETRTGRFMLSVGVNSDAGLLGSAIIDEQNFDLFRFPNSWEDVRNGTAWRGAGQRFRLEAVPGTEVQKYTINFQEPYLLDTRISLGTSGYYYSRRFYEWDEERVGGRVAFGYQFTHDLSGVVAYRGAKINIHDPIVPGLLELDEVLGNNTLHGFEARFSHDTRDNAFLATQGHLLEISFEQVVGSFQYPRGEVELRRYFMLHQRPDGSGRHVLSLGGRAAVTGDDTPIYEHYYAGGFSTIRGFDFRGASPRELSTGGVSVLVGGEFMLLASVEYMFPITADDMLRAVVFCDTGTVEPTIDDWRDKYRVSPGFGLRITIPAMGPAPIALDFGFPIVKNPGDNEQVFSFFVGFLR